MLGNVDIGVPLNHNACTVIGVENESRKKWKTVIKLMEEGDCGY